MFSISTKSKFWILIGSAFLCTTLYILKCSHFSFGISFFVLLQYLHRRRPLHGVQVASSGDLKPCLPVCECVSRNLTASELGSCRRVARSTQQKLPTSASLGRPNLLFFWSGPLQLFRTTVFDFGVWGWLDVNCKSWVL